MLKTITTSENNTTVILDENGSNVRFGEKTNVIIKDDGGGGTFTFGQVVDGEFKAFTDGTITLDGVMWHGSGCMLAVQPVGLTGNAVIWYQ